MRKVERVRVWPARRREEVRPRVWARRIERGWMVEDIFGGEVEEVLYWKVVCWWDRFG